MRNQIPHRLLSRRVYKQTLLILDSQFPAFPNREKPEMLRFTILSHF